MFDSSLQRAQDVKAIAERREDLSARIARLAPVDGVHQAAFPSLSLIRGSNPTVCMPTVCQPSLGFVVQGRKRALLNHEVFHYDALNYLVVSVTLPMMGQVLEASAERPFLCLRLDLDLEEIGRIVRAIEWLKQRYAAPLRIEELAEAVHMSLSALHHRFKAVTAMSPLQYQKHLRLHEARRLMFTDGIECATAGYRVGYESPSQFSREYRRLFGAPPRLEIARLRETGVEA
jgi:AraC-like DNA-binding protein